MQSCGGLPAAAAEHSSRWQSEQSASQKLHLPRNDCAVDMNARAPCNCARQTWNKNKCNREALRDVVHLKLKRHRHKPARDTQARPSGN